MNRSDTARVMLDLAGDEWMNDRYHSDNRKHSRAVCRFRLVRRGAASSIDPKNEYDDDSSVDVDRERPHHFRKSHRRFAALAVRFGSTRAGRACLAAAIHHPRVGRGTHCLGYSSTRNVPLGRLADATLRDAKSRRRGRVDRIIQAVPCRRHVLRSPASSWKALKVTPACCNAPAASNPSC